MAGRRLGEALLDTIMMAQTGGRLSSEPIVIAEFPIRSTPHTLQQSLDSFYANGYAGAIAWCYPNNVDEYCNSTSSFGLAR